MSIIYSISVILLFVTSMLVKKTERKLDFMLTITIGTVLLLCYNTCICYIFTMLNIPIHLMSLTVTNIIISAILGIITCYKKQIQHYQFDKKNIVATVLILMVVILIVSIQYGIPLNIKYIMTDAAGHYASAFQFYQRECLLLKADGISVDKCMMPGAYSNIGILFKIWEPIIGEINLYHIFIAFDIGMLLLSGLVMYFILRKHVKTDLHFLIALAVSILYMIGYPLNSILFGFSYLSVAIVVIETIVLFMEYLQEEKSKIINIIVLFLLCTQVFLSYYLFVPVVYGALGVYYLLYFKQKHNKIWNKEMIGYVLITLVIPTIIGFTYQILPGMTSVSQIQTLEVAKIEGYIYRNLITNILLLIPFGIYFFYSQWKAKKWSFLDLFAMIYIIYMMLVGIAMTKELISTYYFYKLYFILWLVMWSLFYLGAMNMMEKSKKGAKIVYGYIICYIAILVVSLFTIHVKFNKTTKTNETIKDVMDIYGINKTIMFHVREDFSINEIDILKQIKGDMLQRKNTLILANQRQEYWIWAMFQYALKDNLKILLTEEEIDKWNQGQYEYLIYFRSSDNYQRLHSGLELEGKEVIFENSSGAIIKNP